MKPFHSFAMLAAIAAVGQAFAVDATTTPVGYVSLGNKTTGQPAIADGSDVAISIPLVNAAAFTSTVASVAGNVVTLSASPTLGTGPFIAVVESGTKEGLVALVASTSGANVTLTLQPGDSLTGVSAGNTVSIRPASTIKSFFSGNTLVDGLELDAFSGATAGTNLAPDALFFYFAGDWYDAGSNIANDTVLYPGESFIIRNVTGSNQQSLVVSGEVPKFNSRVVISKLAAGTEQDNRISYLSPVDQTIGSSGLGSSDGDQLIFFDNGVGLNKSGDNLFYFAGAWYDGGSNDVTNTFTLKAGEGYIYRRVADAPVGDVVVSDSQSYRASL
ncbi:TIGR02597 family protein [Luteolibacter sp. LG18]|uniref:TIGR02597 family protein n=1 Tax=Luteolibacter sp. LG18 TaxID=2819286 RepID=UPI002B31CF51|nr:hypothetical protein llg_07800 [Luteolibacter sp. LG18]